MGYVIQGQGQVFQNARGGDLLRAAIVDRNSHTSKHHKDEGLPDGEAF
jgi:hypothetical protein